MIQKVFRENNIAKFKKLISKYIPSKIFLVAAGNSFTLSGAKNHIAQTLGVDIPIAFSGFQPNPQIDDLKEGISVFNKGDYELILAVGGGSVIDMAKLISIFAHQKNAIETLVLNQGLIENIKTPLVAIPTTSGSGAEATAFAVLYIDKLKYSVATDLIQPNYVYLLPDFSFTAPSYLTACTGLDAFCQAIESVWSVNSNSQSEEYAYKAVDLIWNNLQLATNENNKLAKAKMQEASFLAGKAINITKTTAPHAISYVFTSYYNIPHGHAVALSLPYFFDYNNKLTEKDCNDSRGSKHVKARMVKLMKILGLSSGNLQGELKTFFNSIGINTNLHTLIGDYSAELVINNVNIERLNNNPRSISKDVISDFLKTS